MPERGPRHWHRPDRPPSLSPSPLEQRHRRRTVRHRRWQTRVAVLSRHPGSVTGRAERPRSSLRPAAWSRPPHLAYVPCLAVAVGAAPSPLEQRHRRRTVRHRRWQTRVAVLSRHPGSVTGRAERPRSSLRPAAWSRPPHLAYVPCLAVAVGAAPSPLEQRHRRRTVRHRRWQTRVAVLSRHPGSVTGRAERPRSSLRPAAWSRPPHLAYVPCLAVAVAPSPLEQRHRRRTVRHRRWQTRVAVLSRHPGSVTGRAERPRSSLRPAAWSRPPHLAYVPCLAVAVGAVAVGAAPSPSDGAPSPLADASSRPLSPPRERHGPCRAATIEPPTGRVVPPTAPRVRALSRRRRWSSAIAVGRCAIAVGRRE